MSRSAVRVMWWAGALVALSVTFAAYLRPDIAFTLATQLWNCF